MEMHVVLPCKMSNKNLPSSTELRLSESLLFFGTAYSGPATDTHPHTHHTPSADPGQTFDNVTLRSWIAAYKFGLNIKHTQM